MNATETIPKRDMAASITGCCPPFEPSDWDGKTFVFKDKLFMKTSTRSVFHIPLNMDAVMKRSMAEIEKAGATNDEYLMLSEEASPWQANHYIATAKEVPGADMVRLNGTFEAKVFEGPYQDMRKWYSELVEEARGRGKEPIKVYFNYTMCPSCAKAYGHNYVVGLAQVA